MGLGAEQTPRGSHAVKCVPANGTPVSLEWGHLYHHLHAHLSLEMLLREQELSTEDDAPPHPQRTFKNVYDSAATTWGEGPACISWAVFIR